MIPVVRQDPAGCPRLRDVDGLLREPRFEFCIGGKREWLVFIWWECVWEGGGNTIK